jgi:hypothetical protein
MTDSINKIGADVAKALRELEKGADAMDIRRHAAQSKLRQVWDALERGEIVNGCTTKKAWAAFAKVDIRTCQYTLKGKRNRSAEVKKRSANHVVRYQELLKELLTVVSMGSPQQVIDKASAICDQIKWMPPDWRKEAEEAAERKAPKKGDKKEETPKGNAVVLIKMDKEDERLHPAVADLEEALETVESITVPEDKQENMCDYTEDEVAAMFSGGGE